LESDDSPFSAWASFRDALGSKVTRDSLVRIAGTFDWTSTIEALATAAAEGAANGPSLKKRLRDELNASYNTEGRPERRHLVEYVNGAARDRSILHERSIHFLQQLMLLHGGDDRPEPKIYDLALMGLMANDYLMSAKPAPSLDDLDRVFADFCHLGLFNQEPDQNSIARLAYIFGRSSPRLRNPKWAGVPWQEFLHRSLGAPFPVFYYELVLPLLMWSIAVWGHPAENEKITAPFVELDQWTAETKVAPARLTEYLRDVTLDRASARSAMARYLDDAGLPRASSIFFHRPLILTRTSRAVAASPGAFWEHLRTALWARCLAGARDLLGKDGAKVWITTFGDLFEDWICHVADLARTAPTRDPETNVILAAVPGSPEEIEDVVVVRGDKVALISVKTAMIRGELPKEGADPLSTVRWWEDFMFRRLVGKNDGAIRLLDTKVAKLRRGAYEPAVGRRLTVYPVLVLYDELGGNPLAARWIERGARRQGLLCDANTRATVPSTAEDFELLMAVVAGGGNIFDVLEETNHSTDPRLRSAVSRYAARIPTPVFGALRREVDVAMETMKERLFSPPV
jgi:hypothetical protein